LVAHAGGSPATVTSSTTPTTTTLASMPNVAASHAPALPRSRRHWSRQIPARLTKSALVMYCSTVRTAMWPASLLDGGFAALTMSAAAERA
jgi:hypothetical protein